MTLSREYKVQNNLQGLHNVEKMERKKKKNCSRIKFFAVFFLITALSFLQSGCVSMRAGSDPENEEMGQLRIVTTIFPQYDFVRQIGGEEVSLHMLLKPGEEPHSYEPTPQDIIAIQKADLFIYVGGENDEWVEDILDSPEMQQVHTLRLVDCVELLEEEQVEGMQKEHSLWFLKEDQESDSHGEEVQSHGSHVHTMDEHVWTSPKNVIRIVDQIAEELTGLDGDHREIYEKNAQDYKEKLLQLDAQFRQVTEEAASRGKKKLLFGDRFPFRYFADEYGLEYYAAFPGCASDTEPSAATMAFLIQRITEEKIPVVLKMEFSNEQIAAAVAETTGAQVKVFYSCHNLTAEQFEAGETYLSLMQENVETLKEALEEIYGIDAM